MSIGFLKHWNGFNWLYYAVFVLRWGRCFDSEYFGNRVETSELWGFNFAFNILDALAFVQVE